MISKSLSAIPAAAVLSMLPACASLPEIDLSPLNGRVALAPLAPEAAHIMCCVGDRVIRYMKDAPEDEPMLTEVSPFRVRVQSAVIRLDMPSEYTSLVEQILTEGGLKIGFLEGMRTDRVGDVARDTAYNDGTGVRRTTAKIRIARDVLFADAAVSTATHRCACALAPTLPLSPSQGHSLEQAKV